MRSFLGTLKMSGASLEDLIVYTEKKRHGGKIVRVAVAEEAEMEAVFMFVDMTSEMRNRKALAVQGGKTCIRRSKLSSRGHSVWLQ